MHQFRKCFLRRTFFVPTCLQTFRHPCPFPSGLAPAVFLLLAEKPVRSFSYTDGGALGQFSDPLFLFPLLSLFPPSIGRFCVFGRCSFLRTSALINLPSVPPLKKYEGLPHLSRLPDFCRGLMSVF